MNSQKKFHLLCNFHFFTHPKLAYVYIICEMKFKDKTYGLNVLLAPYFQIEMQLNLF